MIVAAGIALLFYCIFFLIFRLKPLHFIPFIPVILFAWISPCIPLELQILLSTIIAFMLAFIPNIKNEPERNIKKLHLLLPASYFIILTMMAIARHMALNTGMLDLGNMLQPIYNSGSGYFMELSRGIGNINRLSMHQELIYLFFIPVIKLFPSAITLLVIQSGFVAGAYFAFHGIGQILFKDDRKATLAGALFLLFPAVSFANLAEFHGDTIAIFFISFSLLFLIRSQWKRFFVFALLSMMCKEYIALSYMFVSVSVFFFMKRKKEGLILLLISLIYYFGILTLITNLFRSTGYISSIHYQGGMLTLIRNIFEPDKWQNIILLFMMLMFIPLLKTGWLIPTIPLFGGILLSKYPGIANIRGHHWATALPFFYIAFLYSLRDLEQGKGLLKRIRRMDFDRVALYIIIFSFLSGATAFSYRFWHPEEYYFMGNEKTFIASQLDKEILIKLKEFRDPELRITTTMNLAPHLCKRRFISLLLWNNKEQILSSDYVIYPESEINTSDHRRQLMQNGIRTVINSGAFHKIAEHPLVVFQNRSVTSK
ncbi:DUF2079 domain-containing protein [bacterium]|nr:DUF2079 domain-containing protein [bacterium]